MAVITLRMLKDVDACHEQCVLFKRTFGESVEVTEELAVKHAQSFDFDFAAGKFLKDYEAYKEAKAPLWKAYEEAEAPLWKAYEEAGAPLWKAYEEAEAPLLKSYMEGVAKTFARLYNSELNQRPVIDSSAWTGRQ